jgi:hypothetical protein
VAILGRPAPHDIEEQLAQPADNRSHAAASDRLKVDLGHSDKLHAGAAEEELISQQNLGAIHRPHHYGDDRSSEKGIAIGE